MPITGSNLIGIGVFVLASWLWVRFLAKEKTADHLIEVEGEMKKVTWPSFREASNSSIVVITTVLILMGFLALADFVLGGLFRFVLWDRLAS
ncbi:MAG: preprotein translocase subunit SecE [Planctomycetes bacterium]|nr:preprotein translocase subunit SecE [Planctomycetota bacterium]MBL7008130.1 preprotein translocase subunit SecE [Planctomycetota bacterium]